MIKANRDYLLFDGDCGICTWSSELAKRMDTKSKFTIEPYQMYAESELMKFGFGYEQCTRRLQVITRRGRVYAGAIGVNYFLWQRPVFRPLIILLYVLPLLLLVELIGYRIVAENRHRISAWFGLKACALRR